MKNKILQMKLNRRRPTTPLNIMVFDIDNTIFQAVGTYEKDYDLRKFERDNTFIKNLFLKKLPLAYSIKQYYEDDNSLVIIQTARKVKWWLPLLLFIRGIRYHYLIQRPRANNSPSPQLKKSQLVNFIQNHSEIKSYFLGFIDDSKENRDAIQTLNYAHVYDADYFNSKGENTDETRIK